MKNQEMRGLSKTNGVLEKPLCVNLSGFASGLPYFAK